MRPWHCFVVVGILLLTVWAEASAPEGQAADYAKYVECGRRLGHPYNLEWNSAGRPAALLVPNREQNGFYVFTDERAYFFALPKAPRPKGHTDYPGLKLILKEEN